jgi:hypothetical protein
MHVFEDVVVKGVDADSSELAQAGICELVFALNDAPPPEWRELFKKEAHARANELMEHARFRAGTVVVSVPLVRAAGVVEELVAIVEDTNAAYRKQYAQYLEEEAAFAQALASIDQYLVAHAR